MWVWLCLAALSHVNGAAATGIRVRVRDAPLQGLEDYRHLHGRDLHTFVRLGFIRILFCHIHTHADGNAMRGLQAGEESHDFKLIGKVCVCVCSTRGKLNMCPHRCCFFIYCQ